MGFVEYPIHFFVLIKVQIQWNVTCKDFLFDGSKLLLDGKQKICIYIHGKMSIMIKLTFRVMNEVQSFE